MMSKPPQTYTDFISRFPALGEAWDKLSEAGKTGPLSDRERALCKLALAIGARAESPTRSASRKARDAEISLEEAEQLVALAASTIGMPAAVAAWTTLREIYEKPCEG